jgi:hypothetical protein
VSIGVPRFLGRFASTELKEGDKDDEKDRDAWFAMLGPAASETLRTRVDIDFALDNQVHFKVRLIRLVLPCVAHSDLVWAGQGCCFDDRRCEERGSTVGARFQTQCTRVLCGAPSRGASY